MNAYEATMMAADWIEKNPNRYDFAGATKSPGPNDRGCLIGWIAYFAGESAGQNCGCELVDAPLCRKLVGVSFREFFQRMKDIRRASGFGPLTEEAGSASHCLRAYAAKYLKPTAPQATTPDWMAIATGTNAYRPAERVK